MKRRGESVGERETTIRVQLERLEALCGAEQAITALRLAVGALAYIAEANTLPAAKSTASGALLGIRKDLDADDA